MRVVFIHMESRVRGCMCQSLVVGHRLCVFFDCPCIVVRGFVRDMCVICALMGCWPAWPLIMILRWFFMLGEAYHTVDGGQHALALCVCGRDDCKERSHLPWSEGPPAITPRVSIQDVSFKKHSTDVRGLVNITELPAPYLKWETRRGGDTTLDFCWVCVKDTCDGVIFFFCNSDKFLRGQLPLSRKMGKRVQRFYSPNVEEDADFSKFANE